VYGPAIARLLPAVRALHPDLEVWMVEHGYGRVLARPGLGARERELITVSALAALGWERQLVSHVLGALRVGARPAEVREALAIGARAGGSRERTIARRTWTRASRSIPKSSPDGSERSLSAGGPGAAPGTRVGRAGARARPAPGAADHDRRARRR
jgi:4-carboxymuconolactone decarboxylase